MHLIRRFDQSTTRTSTIKYCRGICAIEAFLVLSTIQHSFVHTKFCTHASRRVCIALIDPSLNIASYYRLIQISRLVLLLAVPIVNATLPWMWTQICARSSDPSVLGLALSNPYVPVAFTAKKRPHLAEHDTVT